MTRYTTANIRKDRIEKLDRAVTQAVSKCSRPVARMDVLNALIDCDELINKAVKIVITEKKEKS